MSGATAGIANLRPIAPIRGAAHHRAGAVAWPLTGRAIGLAIGQPLVKARSR